MRESRQNHASPVSALRVMALVSALVLSVFATDGWAQTAEPEQTPEAVENRLKEKVGSRLDLFLTPKDYRLFATAKVRNFREKVVLEGEMERNTSGLEEKEGAAKVLPGFQKIESKEAPAKDVDRKERSKFTFRSRSQVETISVRLILEQSLDNSVKELAASTTKETIALTFGNVAQVEVMEMDLGQSQAAAANLSLSEWFRKYLTERGGSAIDLLYLAALLVAFLGAVFALRHYYKNKKKAQSLGLAPGESSSTTAKEDAELCNQKLDEIIELLSRSPLLTRNFLQNLSPVDKVTLYQAVRTPALQEYFRKVLGLNQLTTEGPRGDDVVPVFERVLKDLQRYIRLNEEMEERPFGYMPQLTGMQIVQFLAGDANKLQTLGILSPYLAEHHVQEITRHLSIEEKAALLEGMRAQKATLTPTSAAREAHKRDIDERLRAQYAAVKNEAVVDAAQAEALEISFLESDRESVSVIKRLAAKYGTVPKGYEKYLVGFEDFLGLDLGIARKVLQRVSNDTLVLALADRKLDPKMVTLLGEMRSQLVESLKERSEGISERDIEDAQNEVMRLYRSMV